MKCSPISGIPNWSLNVLDARLEDGGVEIPT